MSEKNRAREQQRGGPGRGPGGGPGHGVPVEKAKDFKSGFRRLMRYMARHKIALILVLIMAVGGAVFSIFGPKLLGNATTELFAPTMAQVDAFEDLAKVLPEDVIEQLKNGDLEPEERQQLVMQNADMSDPEVQQVLHEVYSKYEAA